MRRILFWQLHQHIWHKPLNISNLLRSQLRRFVPITPRRASEQRLGNEEAGTNWLSSSSHSTCQSSLRTRTCCCLPSKGPSHIGCPLWKTLYRLRWGEWLHQSFTDIWADGVPVPFNSILFHGRLHPRSFYPCKRQAWRTWHHPCFLSP